MINRLTHFCGVWVWVLSISAGCSKLGTSENISYGQASDGSNKSTPVSDTSFSNLKQTVLAPSCTRCHSNFETESGLSSAINRTNLMASPLLTYVESGAMPPNSAKLSDEKITLIKNYLNALNTSRTPLQPDPTPSPTTTGSPGNNEPTAVRYTEIQQRLFTPSCIACHKNGGRLVPFDSLEAVRENAEPALATLDNGSMPPARFRGTKPTPETIELFRAWIRQGMPE